MVQVGNCCFIIPIRPGAMLIALTFMTISFIGLLLTTSDVLSFLAHPADPLAKWILRACYFVDAHGIAFHSILFIVSTLLGCGIASNISPLMVPWLAASPFFIISIVVQMILVVKRQPDLALPVVFFCFFILFSLIYCTMIVAVYYTEVSTGRIRIRVYDLNQGHLPRIVNVPQRFAGPFFSQRFFPRWPGGTSSTEHLDDRNVPEGVEDERWPKLRQAYARFMGVTSQQTTGSEQTSPEQTQRF